MVHQLILLKRKRYNESGGWFLIGFGIGMLILLAIGLYVCN